MRARLIEGVERLGVVGWLIVGAAAMLSACSTVGGDDLGRRVGALERNVGEMKADVDRLTKIEGDLNLVVGRLNEISGDAPVAPVASPSRSEPSVRAANGGSGIYLGSYRSEASARDAWRISARKMDDARGIAPAALRVDLGKKGVFFRLIAGPFADDQAARAACARLTAARIECAPARYAGKPLD